MLTIFTIPKPFRGHIKVIQTNAIRNWVLLRPACEVILFGNEEGTAEIASELGIRHIPEVECNEYGTPLLSSVFGLAQSVAKHQLMCHVNADIILMSDFLPAVQRVQKYLFLMVGMRWDLELNELLNFDDAQWESQLRTRVAEHGKLHPHGGSGDYFVFPHGLYRNIPPFAVGRTGYDNWLVYQARLLRVPVIDATKAITAVHQNHDYAHHPQGKCGVWTGPEAKRNLELAEGYSHIFAMRDATHSLTQAGLKRVLTKERLYRYLDTLPVFHPWLVPFRKVVRALLSPRSAIRAILRRMLTE